MVNVLVLALSKTTARSGRAPPVKLLATSADGLAPTVKLVSGKTVELGTHVNGPPIPRLPCNKQIVIGKPSPTKKVAGFPSCARNSTWRPLCTSERESEKLTVALGRVSRKVERPPPMGMTAGIPENPFPAKTC